MSVQNILIPIQHEVEQIEKNMLSLLSSQVPFVQSVAEYVIQNGGKRLRPVLTVLCSKLSGFHGEDMYRMGACLEFIHTASLLHDDVIDNAKIRRGKSSANAKWGNHVSVLVGDFFYCRASQLLTEQGDLKILKTVTDAITALTEGEVLEITKSADLETTKEDYLSIIRNKTAVLFAAASQVGGILGAVDEDFEKAFYNYGLNLGMAFQLSDDVLDYTSSQEIFGKENGIDLKEGKLTLPLIIALQKAMPEEKQIIKNSLLSRNLAEDSFQKVFSIINKYEGFQSTYHFAKEYVKAAKESLSPFKASLEKDILLSIADHSIERKK